MQQDNANECQYHPVLLEPAFQAAFDKKEIHVVAPASGLNEERIRQLRTLPYLSKIIPADILGGKIPYHAHDDVVRLEQLKKALLNDNPDQIIWVLRGGYGSARLIDALFDLPIPAYEKIVIGYSDLTALHLFLSQRWGWRTIHGAGFSQLLEEQWDKENFIRLAQCISNPQQPQCLSPLTPLNCIAKNLYEIRGKMNGGNLTLVEASIGTLWQIQTEGCILFLEEVGEKGYRIDRSLTHLKQAGLLSQVNAIVFGECMSQDEAMVHLALERFANEMHIPVFQSIQFGHGETNYPIIYQSDAVISVRNEEFILEMKR